MASNTCQVCPPDLSISLYMGAELWPLNLWPLWLFFCSHVQRSTDAHQVASFVVFDQTEAFSLHLFTLHHIDILTSRAFSLFVGYYKLYDAYTSQNFSIIGFCSFSLNSVLLLEMNSHKLCFKLMCCFTHSCRDCHSRLSFQVIRLIYSIL